MMKEVESEAQLMEKQKVRPVVKKEGTTLRLDFLVIFLLVAKFIVFPDMPWWVITLPLLLLVWPFALIAVPMAVVAVVAVVVLTATHVWEWVEGVWGGIGWVQRKRRRKRKSDLAALQIKRGREG